MIFNASSKIAVKCSECGKFSIINLDFFKLKTATSFRCDCGSKLLKIQIINNELLIEIDCIACEKTHAYKYRLKDIIERPVTIISCPLIGMEIAFLGKEKFVEDIVTRYMEDMYQLLKYLGIVEERPSRVVK
ncbi:hypothetical protein Q428_00495 [Fervidicella metallireducens AeB]|uniref:Uncharacterized protein n=1 Tax=Fervidicella metallireducens AeB TaxID=1403537 RepID=A0A017RYM0_9CLOT|nr:hypothetical protein [Fervidicella metallireducens]EYE89878.1 hypothetical protein Q428_00495 [Fervidicella metallireducens AeB]